MKGKDLFLGMSYIDSKYVEEADNAKLNGGRKPLSIRRPFQLAAMIALLLMLVGCAVAYALKIQNMKVGEQEVTTPVFDEYMEFQGNVTVPQQVLSLTGIKGTPGYMATREWFEFKQSYDPDYAIQESVWGNYPEYPSEYKAYDPYSQEMVDKIDEIAAKYDLKLVGAPVELHGGRRFYQEMGIDSLLTPDSKAQISVEHAGGYEGGSFVVSLFYMDMPSGNEQWPYRMTNCMFFNKKDCFNPYLTTIEDGDWTEWNYTTSAGYNVLLMRCDGLGWIICDRSDATIAIRIELSREEGYNVDGRSWFETVCMTDRQFELVADAFDFSIDPQYQGAVDSFDGVDPKNTVQTQNGYTMELKSAVTDGQRTIITLGVTAPEGVSLTRTGIDGNEDATLLLKPGNDFFELLVPKEGEDGNGSGTWYVEDDGDGRENTQNVVVEKLLHCEEGLAFAPGSEWNFYWEDLLATYWDHGKNQEETLWSVEGNWMFEITFNEGDFREMEMIREPVTTNVVIGWSSKGDDVYEDVVIKSFVLRSLSASVTFEGQSGDLTDYANQKYVTVMLKDGSGIILQPSNGTMFKAESPIDLDQVDYVLLADGTKLTAQE